MKKEYFMTNDEDEGCGGCCDCDNGKRRTPFDHLYDDRRIVYLSNPIAPGPADIAFAEMVELNDRDSTKPIALYLISNGGISISGMQLYDIMQELEAPIHTVCYGMAASMAAILLAAGEAGHRYVSPSAKVMIHLPTFHPSGPMNPEDMDIAKKQFDKFHRQGIDLLVHHTGQKRSKIEKDIQRGDYWMDAHEAVEYGLADKILKHKTGLHANQSHITKAIRAMPTGNLNNLLRRVKNLGKNVLDAVKNS